MLTCQLSQIAKHHVIEPKWLMAPSLRVGHQWLETVVRSGQAVVNFRVVTIRGLAMDLAASQIAEQGLAVLDPIAGAMIVGDLWERGGRDYLGGLERTPSLERGLYESLIAMRLAGLQPSKIQSQHFEVPAKGHELGQLWARFHSELRNRHLIDYVDTIAMAVASLKRNLAALPIDAMILVPSDLDINGLERELIENIPERNRRDLAVDEPSTDNAPDLALFGRILEPHKTPPAKNDGTVELFRAIGTVNEVREVIRRCLCEQRPLDDVELLHSDSETYVPLVYELAQRFVGDDETSDRLPVTFSEGIPASYGRPGRALSAWLSWINQNYSQQHLIRMIHEGLLELAMDEHEISFTGLAAILRAIGIGWGRDRYLAKLDEQIHTVRSCLNGFQTVVEVGAADSAADGQLDEQAEGYYGATRRLKSLELLRGCVTQLLEISNSSADDPALLDGAVRFLQTSARCVTQLDNFAKERLIEEIQRLRQAIELCGGGVSLNLQDWLTELPAQTTIMGSGPRPGCLHVAHLLSGGHSGRTRTFIIGLDDSRFPGAPSQDPILLDSERRRLSSQLPVASAQLEQRLQAFVRLMARLRGKLTLSYSCLDLMDDREMFPSPILLAAFRILSGNHDADQRHLNTLPTASFVADAQEKAVDEGEWWLWRLTDEVRIKDALSLVDSRFPHLGRGRVAATSRLSSEFTSFDGCVPTAGADFDPSTTKKPLSASALETVGQCPLKYFFRYPLQVRLPDEMILDVERWLDPLAFGSLLHEVFRRFMVELPGTPRLPVFDRDECRLAAILNAEIDRYRDTIPPPNEPAFRRQCRQLRRAARIFLVAEAEFCRNSFPEFFETAIGMLVEGQGSPLDTADPVLVPLPGGGMFGACGRIDRMDRLNTEEKEAFAIWDYKTGSSSRYNKTDPFQQGRFVQNSLYVAIAESILRQKVSPSATIASFGYFFPGERDWGHRISWLNHELNPGIEILEGLCQIIAAGSFLPTDNRKDCDFCDYQLICNDLDTVTATAKAKLDHPASVDLVPMRKLRRNAK